MSSIQFDIAIHNATVLCFLNNRVQKVETNIGLLNGKIHTLSNSSLDARAKINAKHLHVLPGVIDSQVHFREPGMTHKEDLETGTRSALMGGVTSVFEMPNTNPPTTTAALLQEKFNRAENRCWTNYAFFVGASSDNAETLGELESIPGCSGVKVFMGSSTGNLLAEDDVLVEKILRHGRKRVIVHSEDEFRMRERKHIAIEGQNVNLHHVWRDAESALLSTKRLIHLARKTNRPVHILHISTKEEMDFLKDHKDICTVEVLPNHLSLFAPDCYDRLGTLAQQNPPIREKHHMEALWKALQNGLVDVIGSDHAPHTLEEKMKPYPSSPSGTPGVQTLVPIMLNHVHQQKLSLENFVELVGEGPRKVFGCLQKGRIQQGLDADLTIVDLKKTRKIENKWIQSRTGWTPFDGMTTTGWPTHAIVNGQLCLEEDQILNEPCGQKVLFT